MLTSDDSARAEAAIVFPLLPGKREALEQFVTTLVARNTEHRELHASVQHESWFLQPTPQGDVVIVYLMSPDPTEVFAELAVSRLPFAVWFRDQVLELSGMDLTLLPPFSLPCRILHWER